MFARSIFSSYYRLLTGASLAFAVFALAGCNEKAAETAAPGPSGSGRHRALRGRDAGAQLRRHHPAPDRDRHGLPGSRQGRQAPGRSRPDRRCRPAARHPRRGRSEAAGRAGGGRIPRRHRRAGAGGRLRAARQGSARQGLDHRRANGPEPRRRRRGAGAPQSRRALGRTHQELSLLCNAAGRHPRRRHRDPDRSRPGRGLRPDRDPRRALCRKGSRGRDPRDAGRPRQVRHRHRDAVVGCRQEICREAARDRARRPIRRPGPISQNSRCRKPTTRSRSA